MDKETYAAARPFAGNKKPSMLRRCLGHDYTARRMYLLTFTVEGRRPLLGVLQGTPDDAHVIPTTLGEAVARCWQEFPLRHPQIQSLGFCLMPDHIHGILYVSEQMDKPLGKVVIGFKTGCNKAFRELLPKVLVRDKRQSRAAAMQQQTQLLAAVPRATGYLWAKGYNDRILQFEGQMERWLRYLQDNPRRLAVKRANPDLFRVQRNVECNGLTFSTIGNRFLLDRPLRLQVQCSRRMDDGDIAREVEEKLLAARRGAVLVSPSISPGERAVMRAAFEEGHPIIVLQENGFTDMAKPGGKRFDACAAGRLLLLAPWQHHNKRTTVTRTQCLSINAMAARLCE